MQLVDELSMIYTTCLMVWGALYLRGIVDWVGTEKLRQRRFRVACQSDILHSSDLFYLYSRSE
jgi:hypothetical protein